jgi:hypothetical protein
VLVNLVGEQPMPSLIPVLQYRPDVAVFLFSDRTVSQVADICAALDALDDLDSVQCVKVPIDPDRFIRSAEVISPILAGYPGAQFLFNLSGGTKLMALSLYRAAEGQGEVIYVSADDECILRLGQETIIEQPIAIQMPAAIYLRAHGAQIDPARSLETGALSQRHFEAADHLAHRALHLERWRRALTKHRRVGDPSFPARVTLPEPSAIELASVDLLVQLGFIEREKEGNRTSFILPDHETWLFLNGGWLEVYALHVARNMRPFHDCRAQVFISHPKLVQNELDLVVMRGSVATIGSCKTGSAPRGAGKIRLLDELEARAMALGVFCGKLLIVSQPRQAYGESFMQRAAQMGIEVATGEELPNLAEALERASRHKGRPKS